MRLEKIKLAGFKSFVDPISVPIPSNLVGIVGPNGCGKSNVIDAVRWVMGESSAKVLRGESMADVIFNGSSVRKPVGTASTELIFDNSEGRAGGQYAQYNTISVKRQVSRDGQSLYYLNSVRCRRRDITDLFLGTGLGPRSYSIIEQGMISRLIEARPEDLRVFLEEAAGISKYKERRKETENRIRHTRENLERLTDLRDEVAKQLQHLQRQAATAEKYQLLKKEERQVKAELLALRWRTLDDDLQQRERNLAEMQNQLEAALAAQRKLESEIEADRERHTEANDQFNEVQGRFYALGAEISGLEQAIHFARDTRRQQELDLEQVEQAWQESEAHRSQDEARLDELNNNLQQEEPRLEEARAMESELVYTLSQAEESMQAWQTEWEQFNQQAAEPAQTAQVERTRINHLEQQGSNLERRLQKLNEELARLDDSRLLAEISELESLEAEQQARVETLQEQLALTVERISKQRDENNQLALRLDQARSELQSNMGRKSSLEALQQAALGKQGDDIAGWLEQRHLTGASRLAQELEVEPRWQRAVEIVLGFHLQAVCVDNLDEFQTSLTELEKGSLTLWDTQSQTHAPNLTQGESLLDKVKAPWSMQSLLGGIEVVEDLASAFLKRRSLPTGGSLITQEGHWLGPNWLRVTRESDESAGVLAREEELRNLIDVLQRQEAESEVMLQVVEQGRAAVHEAEQAREQVQSAFNEVNRKLSEIHSGLSGKRARADHLRQRREQLQQEQKEIAEQTRSDHRIMQETHQRLHQALEAMETLGSRRDALVQRRDQLRDQVSQSRERLNQQRSTTHQIALQVGSMRTAQQSLTQNLERMHSQIGQLAQRREALQNNLASSEEPIRQQAQELEQKLTQRMAVEKELAAVRTGLEGVDLHMRELEQKRHQAEQWVQERRNELDQSRLQRQEVLVRSKTLEEQLLETGLEKESLLAGLSDERAVQGRTNAAGAGGTGAAAVQGRTGVVQGRTVYGPKDGNAAGAGGPGAANEKEWQQRVEQLAVRIQRLGPINLAAIDEFQEQSERLKYLDEQNADITQSLETLENAIRKIDRETRTRFKETFDQVNAGIKELFPRLFGGGHAYLELTGEDLLDTGVTVMARPPGKRNSSIHLLSGGEKALTAVALVFSIFQLNPAPFCMLDEVDAPLDDANVGRFCELVKTMSDRVQFIFITHNKITMEIANQLTGVTMHEPGVSRLVTVDVEEAAQLAAI